MSLSRSRWAESLLAAAATAGALAPATTLVAPQTWILKAVVGCGLALLVGAGLRMLRVPPIVVVIGQLLALIVFTWWTHAPRTLWYGLPTERTAAALVAQVREATETIAGSQAPVPLNNGMTLLLVSASVLVLIAVDTFAATLQRPAAAGLPLLLAYEISAANSTGGLGFGWFVAPALGWLALLGLAGQRTLQRWGRGILIPDGPDGHRALVGIDATRRLAPLAVILALVAAGALPRLDPTYLAGGLARGGSGGAGGGVTLTTMLDIAASLRDQSDDPVLRYSTNAVEPSPLRVSVLTHYADGTWQPQSTGLAPVRDGAIPLAPITVAQRTVTYSVTGARLVPPQVALPLNTFLLTVADQTATVDSTGTVNLREALPDYDASAVVATPSEQELRERGDDPPVDGTGAIDLPPATAERLNRVLDEVLPEDADEPIEIARALQAWLRSGAFLYSTEVTSTGADPILSFLETRRGYCVQFASTMAILAQLRGIPSRVAIGYLPGRFENGQRVVLGSDAHAWPELWFPSLGWVRFEPTPGTRSGVAPGWSVAPTTPTGGPSPTAAEPSRASVAPQERPDVLVDPVDRRSAATRLTDWLRANATLLGGALALLVAVGATPLGAWWSRRRRRRAAADAVARAEVEWAELVERLADLEVPMPVGATPRGAAASLRARAPLSDAGGTALGLVVDGLEQARYGRPGASVPDLAPQVRTVVGAVRGTRARGTRVRALLWPAVGRRHWARLVTRRAPTDDR